jgi:hypothetical protein
VTDLEKLEQKLNHLINEVQEIKKILYGNGHKGLIEQTTFLSTVYDTSKFIVQVLLVPILYLILQHLIKP